MIHRFFIVFISGWRISWRFAFFNENLWFILFIIDPDSSSFLSISWWLKTYSDRDFYTGWWAPSRIGEGIFFLGWNDSFSPIQGACHFYQMPNCWKDCSLSRSKMEFSRVRLKISFPFHNLLKGLDSHEYRVGSFGASKRAWVPRWGEPSVATWSNDQGCIAWIPRKAHSVGVLSWLSPLCRLFKVHH